MDEIFVDGEGNGVIDVMLHWFWCNGILEVGVNEYRNTL